MSRHPVQSQKKWNIGFMVFLTMLLTLLSQFSLRFALILALGIGLGFILQKSRFCFASALRDPLLVGMTELTRAFLLLTGISLLGFALVYWEASLTHNPIGLNIFPLGPHTLVGGMLFGIGMVIAGGCITGILMRVGEGFIMQVVALFGVMVGSVLGERTSIYWRDAWGETPGIFLPDILGWIPTLILEFALLSVLWIGARWWQRKQLGN